MTATPASSTEERQPFDLRDALPSLHGGGWRKPVRHSIDTLLGLRQVRRLFHAGTVDSSRESFAAALHAFGQSVDPRAFLSRVPKTGPVVVMANHPFGGSDALALGALCRALRPHDMLMMANATAARLPVLGDFMLPLSILGGEDSTRVNAPSIKRSLMHLRAGGILAVFPAGEVARWDGNAVSEGAWSPHIAALAIKTGATIVPLRFFGRTPAWLHLAGGVHPLLRTAFLPRVFMGMRGQQISYALGQPIDAAALQGQLDAAAQLRRTTLEI